MSMINDLEALGVNTSEALGRFMNNSMLYEKLIAKYPDSARTADVAAQFAAKDYEKAVEAAHTLKGVTGNLSLTPLYTAYTEIVNLLRAGKNDEAEKLYNETAPIEEKIIAAIEANA